jgi:adenine-specific DNA-methyltransferase
VIEGDNLLALKALEANYVGRVGCIYIDPPYNTGSIFESYPDNLEHSLWLSHTRDRLSLLWSLLKECGTLLISINDDQAHYLKVLCDELFGRSAFKATLIWNTEGNTDNQAKIIRYHEYVLVYAKGELRSPGVVDPNVSENSKLNRPEIRNTIVKNGPKNPVSTITLPVGFPAAIDSVRISPRNNKWPHLLDELVVADGKLVNETRIRSGWSSKDICESFIRNDCQPVLDSKGQKTRFEITANGVVEGIKEREADKGHFLSVLRGFGTTNQMRLLLESIGVKFSFPKPVRLIRYLLEAFSEVDDIILDSYAGSGTTGHAVLQLNAEGASTRRFILVEQFPHTIKDVLVPRLKAVINGDQRAGLKPTGGGFEVFKLAPSLLDEDRFGRRVISNEYDAEMLSEAMCKHFGFSYEPSEEHYWMHGRSSESDFIYATANSLTHEQLRSISDEVGHERTLLICCKAFQGANADIFANLTIRKIPGAILNRCEWGRDDYSLKMEGLPEEGEYEGDETAPVSEVAPPHGQAMGDSQHTLGDGEHKA